MYQVTEHVKQTISDKKLLDKHAKTEDPYKKMFKMAELPRMAAAPIINIPVPKKNDETIEIQKCFLKIIFKKTYRLAQPKLIKIFPSKAHNNEPKLTTKDKPTKAPAKIVPTR